MTWALAVVQAALYALMAPLFVGLARWLEARLQGRRGPDPVQPYRDLSKLMRKRPSIPSSASGVFLLAPPLIFTCFLLLGFAFPIFYVLPQPGMDLVLVVAVLGLAKFVAALAAFDAGAPFGPMSSGRQLFVHVLAEPALLIVIDVYALTHHTTNLASLAAGGQGGNPLAEPAIPLMLVALACVLLAEVGRLPFDNPATHLELTMIEQGTGLEYSGRALALVEWAGAMRLTFALSLLANLTVPWGVATDLAPPRLLTALLVYLAKVCFLLVVLAFWEVQHGKVRLRAIVSPLMLAMGVLLFAVVALVVKDILPTR
jgi:formate hydrogenlyase subunit 4